MTHQDLLDKWCSAELVRIGEFSGNFHEDWRELIEKADTYALANGLTSPAVLDEYRVILAEQADID